MSTAAGPLVRGDPRQLERPLWSALTTTQAGFALGNDLARCDRREVGLLCAVREGSDACLAALAALRSRVIRASARPGSMVAC